MAARSSARSLARSNERDEPKRGSRAERTRAAILHAAEVVFAERGFAATRLEDVADRVGIRRASIVYHFRDKRELYDAILGDVFGGLLSRSRALLEEPKPLVERIEAAVRMFVDTIAERPSLPRLLLREVADDSEERPPLTRHTRPFTDFVAQLVRERRARQEAHLTTVDPAHLASAIVGAVVFVAAVPGLQSGAMPREVLEAHRSQVLEITRRLLGVDAEGAGGPERSTGRGETS